MEIVALLWLVAKFVLLLAGLLGPGAALMRALRLPLTVATCFAGSALALYTTVLGLQLASVRISLVSLTGGLVVIALVAHLGRGRAITASFDGGPASARAADDAEVVPPANPWGLVPQFTRMGAWTPLYLLFWASILWRAWHEPLAGPDVDFRWSFLAEQMLRLGTLDFYPPRSAGDFHSYFWVESIPPGISALHAWAYACAGDARASWTVPTVLLQFLALHELLWRTAHQLGGPRAARFACLAAAACPLLTWSILLGQETGMTALSLVGTAFALQRWQETPVPGWAALAGAFAALGAAAREYGLVFPALAMAGLWFLRANRRSWLAFVAITILGLVWPIRVWILTGNPFYSLGLGGLPINPRFVAWIEHDADALGSVLQGAAGWREVLRYAVLFAPSTIIGGAALMFAALRGRRTAGWALVSCLAVLGLWITSVRYTNGGLFYSLRVTSPALALSALAAGIGVSSVLRPGLTAGATILLGLCVAAALPSTLALPKNPWRTPPSEWPVLASPPDSAGLDATLAIVRNSPGGATGVIIADAPGFQRHFAAAGLRVIPLWSPQADWLFDASLAPAEAARRWRESGVRQIVVTKLQTNVDFFNARSRWAQPPFRVRLVGETSQNVVFAIQAID